MLGTVISGAAFLVASTVAVRGPDNPIFDAVGAGGGILSWLGINDLDELPWHVGEPTTAPAIAPARSPPVEANAQQLIAPEAVEALPGREFDQTANLTAEAGDYQRTSPVDADVEPVPELEFDQTLGW